MNDLINEYFEALAEVIKYNKSLKWVLNFFDEDDEVALDAKDALRYAKQDFKRVVKLLQEHDIDIAKLILINQKIDEDFMNELYGDDELWEIINLKQVTSYYPKNNNYPFFINRLDKKEFYLRKQ